MYCFQHAGVKIDSATKISVDARLANATDILGTIGPTKVGHYSRDDYARLQKMTNEPRQNINLDDTREPAWQRSSTAEAEPTVNAGYRALSSLQLANNSHIVNSLFSQPIFSLGYGPVVDEITHEDIADPKFNLRYNRTVDLMSQDPALRTGVTIPTLGNTPLESTGEYVSSGEVVPIDPQKALPVDTLDVTRESAYNDPKPKVDAIFTLGDDLNE